MSLSTPHLTMRFNSVTTILMATMLPAGAIKTDSGVDPPIQATSLPQGLWKDGELKPERGICHRLPFKKSIFSSSSSDVSDDWILNVLNAVFTQVETWKDIKKFDDLNHFTKADIDNIDDGKNLFDWEWKLCQKNHNKNHNDNCDGDLDFQAQLPPNQEGYLRLTDVSSHLEKLMEEAKENAKVDDHLKLGPNFLVVIKKIQSPGGEFYYRDHLDNYLYIGYLQVDEEAGHRLYLQQDMQAFGMHKMLKLLSKEMTRDRFEEFMNKMNESPVVDIGKSIIKTVGTVNPAVAGASVAMDLALHSLTALSRINPLPELFNGRLKKMLRLGCFKVTFDKPRKATSSSGTGYLQIAQKLLTQKPENFTEQESKEVKNLMDDILKLIPKQPENSST